MQFNYIKTSRLKLRLIDNEVMTFVFKRYSDEELYSFFGIKTKEELEKEKFRFAHGLITFNRKFLYFHLIDIPTNKVIGWCGYHTWYIDHDRAEIGYGLYDDSWKQKGLMSEAMEAILKYGFETMKLHRIEALIGRDNIASFKVLEKFNFQKEGELLEHYLTGGKHEDSIIYALIM